MYFPLSLRMEKEREFMQLKEVGDMMVAQYKDIFTQLIKYMSISESDERIKAQRFLGVLKLRIQKALGNISTQSYTEIVLKIMTTEANLDRIVSIQGVSQQATKPRPNTGKKLDPK